jgi:hypothetical protein
MHTKHNPTMASAASPSAADPKMADLCNHIAHVFARWIHRGWVLQTSHSAKYLWRYLVGQWLGFCCFLGWQTSDTRLARRKLGKKIHPDHGGRSCPMAAMAPRSRRWGITKLANILRDKSVPLNFYGHSSHNALWASRQPWWLPSSYGRLVAPLPEAHYTQKPY